MAVTPDRRRRRLADAVLYLCVDRRAGHDDLEGFLEAVLAGGVDVVQLRDKHADETALRAAAAVFRRCAQRHEALFVLNDDPALAADVDADGVHVGQDDAHPDTARAAVGDARLVGRSTHSVEQIDRALDEDCDTFTVGPVHATPTKQGRPGIGLAPVRHAAVSATTRPWFVSGGMSGDSAEAVLAAGGRRLVVVRALTGAADPRARASELSRRLRRPAGDRG